MINAIMTATIICICIVIALLFGISISKGIALNVVRIVWAIFCLFFLTVMLHDFYQALKHPELYHFGEENPFVFWYYWTQKLYLSFSVAWIFWNIAGFLFCVLQNKFKNLKWGMIIHIVITLLYLFVYAVILPPYYA